MTHDNWEARAITVLSALQTAIARELAARTILREARERNALNVAELQQAASAAGQATTEAFAAWEREVRAP